MYYCTEAVAASILYVVLYVNNICNTGEISPQRKCESPINHSLSQKDPRRMTVLSLLPPPLADIALTHSLHHDRFIEFMAISVI